MKCPHGATIVHTTSYDGCVELAALQLGYGSLGFSSLEPNYKCAKEVVKSHLVQAKGSKWFGSYLLLFSKKKDTSMGFPDLPPNPKISQICLQQCQAWKAGQKPMDQHTPRYKPKPSEEDLPKAVKAPELKCCQIVGEKLVLPSDVRSMFLSCPVFGPEWRDLLSSFDKQWAAPVGTPTPTSSPIKKETKQETTGTKTEVKEEGAYDWKAMFPGEPVTYEELKKKHGEDQCTEIPGGVTGLLLVLAPGPSLYVVGKTAVTLDMTTPFITHGPGTWLLGDKANKYIQNNPGKGFVCQWTSDQDPVCMEEIKFETCFAYVEKSFLLKIHVK